MELPPESRDLAALDHTRRMHLRDVGRFGLALGVFVAPAVWFISWLADANKDAFSIVWSIFTVLIGFALLVMSAFFVANALCYLSVLRQISETRSIQAAMAAHHDLPPPVIARMAGKAWQWRALCLSGGVMIVSGSALAAIGYLHPRGNESVQAIGIAIPLIALLWSIFSFVLAAMRFIRFARSGSPQPPPGSGR